MIEKTCISLSSFLLDLKSDSILYKKILRIAQFESEMDLGVNSYDYEQARTAELSSNDFNYIERVCNLVEKRFRDYIWLVETINSVTGKSIYPNISKTDIRCNDELYKPDRGILEQDVQKY